MTAVFKAIDHLYVYGKVVKNFYYTYTSTIPRYAVKLPFGFASGILFR